MQAPPDESIQRKGKGIVVMQNEQQFNDMLDLHALAERFIDIRRENRDYVLSVPILHEDELVPEPEKADPTLAVFYDPQDQGDG